MQEVVIERRDQIEVGQLLGRDQFERARDVEAWQTDEGAADQRHGKKRAHAHGVIERHGTERALTLAVEILRDMRKRCGALGALTSRHAFRARGRARGIEHDRPCIGADARRPSACALSDKSVEGHRVRVRVTHGDPRARARSARRAHGLGRDLLVHDRLGFGVIEAEIQFARAGAPIERRDDDAGELACPVDRRRFPPILQQRDEMVARVESKIVEAGDKRRNLSVPGVIGQPQLTVDDRQRVGITRHTGKEARAEIKHGGRGPVRTIAQCVQPAQLSCHGFPSVPTPETWRAELAPLVRDDTRSARSSGSRQAGRLPHAQSAATWRRACDRANARRQHAAADPFAA